MKLRTPFVSVLVLATLAFHSAFAVPARAQESTPAKTVAAFYDWYVAHDGRFQKNWAQVRNLFNPELWDAIDGEDFKAGPNGAAFEVLPCNQTSAACKTPVAYDPFANSRWAATSFTIGRTKIDGSQAKVHVTLVLANGKGGKSHLSMILKRDGARYVISNMLYDEARYYYPERPITNFNTFLSAWVC